VRAIGRRRPAAGGGVVARLRAWALPLVLLALVLQGDAVVRSTVMQLVGMPPSVDGAPLCGMGAMTMAAMPGHPRASHAHAGKAHTDAAACPYCAVAHHLATLAVQPPLRPSSCVSFPAYRVVAARGPRGPPLVLPRARGPPSSA
jgi:hypothetical protein